MWSLMVAMASIVMSRLDVSQDRDVSTGATGVAPKFSDTLTLSQPGLAHFLGESIARQSASSFM